MKSGHDTPIPEAGDPDASVENEPNLTSRQKAETRLWLQVLNVHRLIYGDLNSALSEKYGLSIPKFDVLAQLLLNFALDQPHPLGPQLLLDLGYFGVGLL